MRARGAALCIGLCLLVALPAGAFPVPGRTERVSVGVDGTEGNDDAGLGDLSADGRFVAFETRAYNLLPEDTWFVQDIYVRDRLTGSLTRVSVTSDGQEAYGESFRPSISADGRYVAFDSYAGNLAEGDTNGCLDVFVHDRATGVTRIVSASSDGTIGNLGSAGPTISPDGTVVAFNSYSTNLVRGDSNGLQDMYVHDLQSGETEVLTFDADPVAGYLPAPLDAPCMPNPFFVKWRAGLSEDGSEAAFMSERSLVPEDTNGYLDVYVKDREQGTLERVSVSSQGLQGNHDSWWPEMTPDGRYVVFQSSAWNLVPGDGRVWSDVFVHDRVTNVTERVSVSSSGTGGDDKLTGDGIPVDEVREPAISDDGRFVAYVSNSDHLVPEDQNSGEDVFLHDRLTGSTRLVSVILTGEGPAGGLSRAPMMDAAGRYVVYESLSPGIVARDKNGAWDTFLAHMGPPLGAGEVGAERDGNEVTISGWSRFAGGIISQATDPQDQQEAVRSLGLDLTGVEVVYRPEEGDLQVRFRVPELLGRLPSEIPQDTVSDQGGYPAIVYGLRYTTLGSMYEIRASHRPDGPNDPPGATFEVYECTLVCTAVASTDGGFGTVGDEVRVTVSTDAAGTGHSVPLTAMQAYTAMGDAAAPGPALDTVSLPSVMIPRSTIEVGLAPPGTPEDGVLFSPVTFDSRGRFTKTIAALSGGALEAVVRTCLGTACVLDRAIVG